MNIAIFTDTYYPQINGVVTSIRTLERELNKLGHKVYIFTVADPNAKRPLPRVFRLPSMPFFFSPAHRLAMLYSPKLLFKIKKLNLDIIHTQTEFPLGIFGKVVSEFYKIPMVHTYHTMYEDYVHYLANGHLLTANGAKKYSRFFCNRAKVVIAPVEKTKEKLIEYGVIRPIEVVPTGINFEPFSRQNFSKEEIDITKKELGLLPTDKVIVSVGRVAKEKSIDVLIEQMPKLVEKLPEVKLVIVGDGPVLKNLQELAKQLGVESCVIFAGSKPWDTIGKYYQIGDVFATASTTETQGLTYMEAMAAKVPVVAKKDKSIEGIVINGETGFYFEKDSEAADVLYYVLTNEKLAHSVAEKGYDSIQYISAVNFGKNLEAIYLKVLSENAAKGENTKGALNNGSNREWLGRFA